MVSRRHGPQTQWSQFTKSGVDLQSRRRTFILSGMHPAAPALAAETAAATAAASALASENIGARASTLGTSNARNLHTCAAS